MYKDIDILLAIIKTYSQSLNLSYVVLAKVYFHNKILYKYSILVNNIRVYYILLYIGIHIFLNL